MYVPYKIVFLCIIWNETKIYLELHYTTQSYRYYIMDDYDETFHIFIILHYVSWPSSTITTTLLLKALWHHVTAVWVMAVLDWVSAPVCVPSHVRLVGGYAAQTPRRLTVKVSVNAQGCQLWPRQSRTPLKAQRSAFSFYGPATHWTHSSTVTLQHSA